MENFFSISEAAKMVNMTSETLRHYDRIGLVKASRRDEESKYRYYTKEDIVRLHTIRALQQMDLSLHEIKCILEYDDLQMVVDFLKKAEKTADEKIAELQYSKSKIQLARSDYEKKLYGQQNRTEFYTRYFPKRVILLSNSLEAPTLDNLWNYLSHFYDRIEPSQRDLFAFEDLAGIYTEKNLSRLFAVCIRYTDMDGLKIVPSGTYLCADCTEQTRGQVLSKLIQIAKEQYHLEPTFTIQLIVISGILQWNYQIQILIEDE